MVYDPISCHSPLWFNPQNKVLQEHKSLACTHVQFVYLCSYGSHRRAVTYRGLLFLEEIRQGRVKL